MSLWARRSWAHWLGVLMVAAFPFGCRDRSPEPLPDLGRLDDFALVDHRGEPFGAEELDGSIWVVDFIFTSCRVYCPMLTERMRELREELAEHRGAVRFLSISVDPEHDTSEVLGEYARRHRVSHDDWTFLTGDTKQVTRAVVKGFKTPIGERVPLDDGDGYDILHARHFVLLDRERRLRGYYRTETEELERLARDVGRLATEKAFP